jgi:hypothetical protein
MNEIADPPLATGTGMQPKQSTAAPTDSRSIRNSAVSGDASKKRRESFFDGRMG